MGNQVGKGNSDDITQGETLTESGNEVLNETISGMTSITRVDIGA